MGGKGQLVFGLSLVRVFPSGPSSPSPQGKLTPSTFLQCWVLWARGFLSFHTFSDQIKLDSFEILHLLQSISATEFQLSWWKKKPLKYIWDILKRLKSVHVKNALQSSQGKLLLCFALRMNKHHTGARETGCKLKVLHLTVYHSQRVYICSSDFETVQYYAIQRDVVHAAAHFNKSGSFDTKKPCEPHWDWQTQEPCFLHWNRQKPDFLQRTYRGHASFPGTDRQRG